MRKEILVMLLVIVSMGTFVSAQDTGQMLIIGNFEQSTVSITVPENLIGYRKFGSTTSDG